MWKAGLTGWHNDNTDSLNTELYIQIYKQTAKREIKLRPSLYQTGWFILTPSPPLISILFFLKKLDLWSTALQYKTAESTARHTEKELHPSCWGKKHAAYSAGSKNSHLPSSISRAHFGRAARGALKGHSECRTSHWHVWPTSISVLEAFLAPRSAFPPQSQPALGYHSTFHLKVILGSCHS